MVSISRFIFMKMKFIEVRYKTNEKKTVRIYNVNTTALGLNKAVLLNKLYGIDLLKQWKETLSVVI